jgi:uncharacterized membrane protein
MDNGKTTAIISYFTFLGAIIAIFMNLEDKKPLASFHIRQSLGIFCVFFLTGYVMSGFKDPMINLSFLISFFALWLFGFISAIEGNTREIPFIGPFFQKFFKSIG